MMKGEEVGRELLERKATGYISFVRGENPYTFPYRIWPSEFAPEKTFENNGRTYNAIKWMRPLIQNLEHIISYI